MTPKQALIAPPLHRYFFLLNLIVIFTSSTTKFIIFIAIGSNVTSLFYSETIISPNDVLFVISIKKVNLFLQKKKIKQFKANYPLGDACFILDYHGCNKEFFTDQMISIFSHCSGSLPKLFKVSVLQ